MSDCHQSLFERKIIHFDMDAFYASVEVRDNPSLRGKPVVVGGSPQSRGVVCTANYEARKFGVRSAMPCSHAYRLCPEAVFIRPHFDRYRSVSQQVRKIFLEVTSKIEPLSLDEAYLDVTHDKQGRYASQIARYIQDKIWDDLHLTGSAGVAPNKMIAKIASEFRKPFGITVITPQQVQGFIMHLPLRAIPGIGPASQSRLAKLGFHVCQDIWNQPLDDLQNKLGQNMGEWLYWRSRGIDQRPVESSRERKSISLERTFAKDISDIGDIKQILQLLVDELIDTLQQKNIWGRTWTLKIKYYDFKQSTRSFTQELPQSRDDSHKLWDIFTALLKKTEAEKKKVRLLGVGCSKLEGNTDNEESSYLGPSREGNGGLLFPLPLDD